MILKNQDSWDDLTWFIHRYFWTHESGTYQAYFHQLRSDNLPGRGTQMSFLCQWVDFSWGEHISWNNDFELQFGIYIWLYRHVNLCLKPIRRLTVLGRSWNPQSLSIFGKPSLIWWPMAETSLGRTTWLWKHPFSHSKHKPTFQHLSATHVMWIYRPSMRTPIPYVHVEKH